MAGDTEEHGVGDGSAPNAGPSAPNWVTGPGIPDPEALLPTGMLHELSSLDTAELRTRRAACEEAEEGVSYARRLLQGRLDLLRAELHAREGDTLDELRDRLPAILAQDDAPSDPLKARSTRLRVPPSADAHAALLDTVVDESTLLHSRELDEQQLSQLMDRIAEHERQLSRLRRALFDRIDALRDELAARYKDGRADVGELLR